MTQEQITALYNNCDTYNSFIDRLDNPAWTVVFKASAWSVEKTFQDAGRVLYRYGTDHPIRVLSFTKCQDRWGLELLWNMLADYVSEDGIIVIENLEAGNIMDLWNEIDNIKFTLPGKNGQGIVGVVTIA